jgi:RHS repeat-associated protein
VAAAVNLPAAVTQSTTGYNADNEQTSFGSASSLTYDANGNLKNDGTNVYTWDARNHLSAISGGVTAGFAYDAFGRRASKTIGGNVTQFLYDGLNPVQELNGTPSVTANLLVGLRIDEYVTRSDSSGTVSLLNDALGSTLAVVGSGGTIGTTYTYQPFGATTIAGSNGNPYQFTGRENDGTGLYFYRTRYYSPTYQRFIGQDPIGFRGRDANLYGYVRNNPISLTDWLGLSDINYTPSGSSTTPGTLTIYDENGNLVGEFPAGNNNRQ